MEILEEDIIQPQSIILMALPLMITVCQTVDFKAMSKRRSPPSMTTTIRAAPQDNSNLPVTITAASLHPPCPAGGGQVDLQDPELSNPVQVLFVSPALDLLPALL